MFGNRYIGESKHLSKEDSTIESLDRLPEMDESKGHWGTETTSKTNAYSKGMKVGQSTLAELKI